jgi:prepilin-type N-terminal cleavage/methylation domain-containing protein
MKINNFKKGFTIMEMMVAMAVLSMIVLAMARIFQQSNTAADTGYNLAHGTLVGRTLLQFVVDDLGGYTDWPDEADDIFNKVNVNVDDNNAADSRKFSENVEYLIKVSGASKQLIRRVTTIDGTTDIILFENPDANDFGNISVSLDEDVKGVPGWILEPGGYSTTDTLKLYPAYVDIYIRLAVKRFAGSNVDDDKRIFSTRVYLKNKNANRYIGKYK